MQTAIHRMPRTGLKHGRTAVKARTAQMERPVSSNAQFAVNEAQKQAFKRDGFVHLSGVVSEEELAKLIDPVYSKFLKGEIQVPGKDLSDASVMGAQRSNLQDFSLLSIMLPRTYYPAWQGNALEQRMEEIARQLLDTDEVELDFDQILAKKPRSRDSGMPWHQDAAYWPVELSTNCASATANIWIAVSDVPVESGCMRYVPGSHLEKQLRPHVPASPDTEGASLRAPVGGEKAVLVPMKRGDVVVHHERVVHGSGPNMTDNWRCGYIMNFKRAACVMEERALGYTGSLNDVVSWKRRAAVKH